MVVAINYADKKYENAQILNSMTAIHFGANKVISYSPQDIDDSFYEDNIGIISQPRGNGYWIWKPYFIKKTLDQLDYGDYLVYSDSGAAYVDNIGYLVDELDKNNESIMVFGFEGFKEYQFTKRDAFVLMDCDEEHFVNSFHRCASYILIKKDDLSKKFIDEYLQYACDERIITDMENTMGLNNYEGFIDHRHDQSILSLLSKKWKIMPFRDPSQYGNSVVCDGIVIRKSDYPQIFYHHRRRSITCDVEEFLLSLGRKD